MTAVSSSVLDSLLCLDIYATSRLMTRAYRPLLAALDLTYPQYLVMVALWDEDGRTVKNLGDTLELDSGTLSPLLKRLEAAGLITRNRTRKDEREVEVRLTPVGTELRERAHQIPGDLAALICLSGEESAGLQRQLRALRHNIERALDGETVTSAFGEAE
jgi:MarR family transcriptional regulator, organic hydroperoxide resistance regulator